jgi:hypothetical protein
MERQKKAVRQIDWDLDRIPPQQGFELLGIFMEAQGKGTIPIDKAQPYMELAAGPHDPPLTFSEYAGGLKPFFDMLGEVFQGVGGNVDDPKVSGS